MMATEVLSIIVLNYNTCELLRNCLRSILRYAPQAEIIVIDNASTDNSATMVAAEFPSVKLFANSVNVGFARGMNTGLRAAQGPHCLCLNADTELLPETLPPLQSVLAQIPSVGIVGPAQYLPPLKVTTEYGTPLASVFRDPTLFTETLRLLFFTDAWAARLKLGSWRPPAGPPRSVDWLMGAALLIRRDCFTRTNGFDEGGFMYGEDWDLCYRARQTGWQVYFVPQARILHHENAAGKIAFGAERIAHVLTGNLYFHEKHYGRRSRRAVAALHWVGAWLRLGILALSGASYKTGQWRAQHAIAQVAWHGLQAGSL